MAENTYDPKNIAKSLALAKMLQGPPRGPGELENDLITMGSREALLPEQMPQEAMPIAPPPQSPSVSSSSPSSPSLMSVISQKLFGGPGVQDSSVKDLTERLSDPRERDAALREMVARRSLEADQFGKEGSSAFKRMLLGAAIGSKAGLEAPYGAGGLGVGITAGLQGVRGVSENEAAIAKSKRESASESLAKLMASEQAKTEEARKKETETADSTSRLLSQSSTITPWQPGQSIPENSVISTIGGKTYAFTAKPEYSELFKLMQATGANQGKIEENLLKTWQTYTDELSKPKTPATSEARARTILAKKQIEQNLMKINPMYAFPPTEEPTQQELAPKGFGTRVGEAMFGASGTPQEKVATLSGIEQRLGYAPDSLNWISDRDRKSLLSKTPEKQAEFVKLLIKERQLKKR